jgi:hypothetical protein
MRFVFSINFVKLHRVCKKKKKKKLSHHLLATIPSILPHFINRQTKKIDRWRQERINQNDYIISSLIFLFSRRLGKKKKNIFQLE